MRFTLQWVGIILVVAAVDLAVRFRIEGDYGRVLWVEAILFPLAAFALNLLFRSRGRPSGGQGRFETVVVWAFFLAGIRSGLWAAGLPVGVANLVLFLLAILGWTGSRLRKRGGRQ